MAITEQNGDAADKKWFFHRAITDSENFPKWRAAEIIILLAVGKMGGQNSAFRRAHRSMMMKSVFCERFCFPTKHPRRHHGYPIHAARAALRVAADFLETLAAKQLGLAGHKILAFKAVARRIEIAFDVRRAGDSKLLVFGKLLHEKFHEVRLERDVGVQISDDVKLRCFQEFESGVDGVGFAGEMAFATARTANERNPWKACAVIFDNFRRAIRRAVVHNDPMLRQLRLCRD